MGMALHTGVWHHLVAVLVILWLQYSGGAISTIDKDVLRKTRTLSRTTLSQTRSTELFHTRSELSETKSDFSQTRPPQDVPQCLPACISMHYPCFVALVANSPQP